MTPNSTEKTLTELILRETASRFGVAVPDSFAVPGSGGPVRLGYVLDGFRSGGVARHLSAGSEIILQDLKFYPAESVIEKDSGAVINLTEKERDILLFLLQVPGNRISREDLLHHVWGYADGIETHTLETHIYRLRQKIEDSPGKPRVLLTEGDGYRLYIKS